MRAKNLMIPLQEYVTPDNSIREFATMLRTAVTSDVQVGVQGLPVLGSDGKLAGVIAMRDILKAVYPGYMSMMNLGHFTWDGMLETLAQQAQTKTVGEVMTRTVITVTEEDPVMECIGLMIKHGIRMLPVMDRSERIAGMIYEQDIFFAITKSMIDETGGGGQ